MNQSGERHHGHGGIEQAFKGLIAAQLLLGKELLKIAAGAAGSAVEGCGIRLPKASSCCRIPEPCWMPLEEGVIHCELQHDSKGTLDIDIYNDDLHAHSYAIHVTGPDAGLVSLTPTVLTLGPKLHGIVHAAFAMPPTPTKRQYEVVIWVIGCRSHFIRWIVGAADKCCGAQCCHDVTIHDQPDYVMHWYDHFYCVRPCMGQVAHIEVK